MLITHRPYNKTRNVISVFAGYPYKKASKVKASIDGNSYSLVPEDETAWTSSPTMDATMVAAMRAGKSMILRGVSGRGTRTTDTYSLKGVTAAHNAIGKACGIR